MSFLVGKREAGLHPSSGLSLSRVVEKAAREVVVSEVHKLHEAVDCVFCCLVTASCPTLQPHRL